MAPTEIIPRLWIGDTTDNMNHIFFKDFKIECVINCTKEQDLYPENKKNKRLEIDKYIYSDNISSIYNNINSTLEYIYNFIIIINLSVYKPNWLKSDNTARGSIFGPIDAL